MELSSSQNFSRLKSHSKEVLENQQKLFEHYYNLGIKFQNKGDFKAAINNYKAAITTQPNSFNAYNNLGCIFLIQQEFGLALQIFQMALARFPHEAILYNNLGQVFLNLEQPEKAIVYFKKALEIDPDDLVIERNLGKAFYQLRLLDQACVCFQKVIAQQPNYYSVYSDLGFLALETGQRSLALNCFKFLAQKNQKIIDFYGQNEISTKTTDEVQRAKQFCTHFLKGLLELKDIDSIFYTLSLTYVELGKVLLKLKQHKTAECYYYRAIQSHPNCVDYYQYLAICLSQQGKVQAAKVVNFLSERIRIKKNGVTHRNIPANKYQYSSCKIQSETHPCQGLNCNLCLSKIFKQFKPIQVDQNIYKLHPPQQELARSEELSVSVLSFGSTYISPQQNDWLVCDQILVFNQSHQFIPKLSRTYPGQLPGCHTNYLISNEEIERNSLPSVEFIDGTVAIVAGLSGNIYFHWMVDILPRLAILKRDPELWEKIDFFLVNSSQQPFQRETLERLGIPRSKILESDRHPHIQAKTLIVPPFASDLGWFPKWAFPFYQQTFLTELSPSSQFPERIYISRKHATYRRVVNEEAIISTLSQFGFVSICLESLSVQEQANLFAHAKVIVATHGSGLTNLIFCQPETTIIEIFSPYYIRHYYWVISQYLGLQHYYILAENFDAYPLRQLMYPNPLTEDLLISPDCLEKVLKIAGFIKSPNPSSSVNLTMNSNPSALHTPMSSGLSHSQPQQMLTGAISPPLTDPLPLSSPEDLDVYLKGAEALYNQKNYEQAAVACQRILATQPDATAYKILGNIRQAQNQLAEAMRWYAKAIQLQPNYAEAFTNLGTVYAQQQQWQQAIACYQKAILLQPKLGASYRNLARAWTQLGKTEEAAACWHQAYQIEPELIAPEEHVNLANQLLNLGLVTPAISSYCQAIQQNPYSEEAYKQLGQAIKHQMKLTPQELEYQNAIALNATGTWIDYSPKSSSRHLHSTQSSHHPAITPYQKVQKWVKGLLPVFPSSSLKSASVNEPNAMASFPVNSPTQPQTNSTSLSPNLTQNSLGSSQDSIAATVVVTPQPDLAEAYQQLSDIWNKSNQPHSELSVSPASSKITDYLAQAEAYCKQRDFEKAITTCQLILKIDPNTGLAYKTLGQIELAKRQPKKAVEFYSKAIKLGLKDAEVYLNLGNFYAHHQDWKKAILLYQKSLDVNPKFALVYRNLAKVWQHLGKTIEAAGCWYEAYSLEPNKATETEHFQLGNTLFEQGQWTQAITCYHRTLQLNPQFGKAYQKLAEALKNQGQLDEAEIYFKKALQFKSEDLTQQPGLTTHTNGKTKQPLKSEEIVLAVKNRQQKVNQTTMNGKVSTPDSKAPEVIATNQVDLDLKQAELDFQKGEYESAILACKKSIKNLPKSIDAYKICGDAFKALGQFEEAKTYYQKAIEIQPNFSPLYHNLGEVLMSNQNFKGAINCYQKLIKLEPKGWEAYHKLGDAYQENGQFDEAVEVYQRAIELAEKKQSQ